MSQITQKAIAEAFITLLNERPLDKITVKDITESIGITRNTFYYHFTDIPTLLVSILNEEAKKVILPEGDDLSWEDNFISAAKFSLDNKKLIFHIYKSVRREDVEHYLNTIARDVMQQYVEKRPESKAVSEDDKRLIIEFYKSALVGLIIDWLNTGMSSDPVLIIKRIGSLLKGNIELVLERAAK